jgi:hypothetical protein
MVASTWKLSSPGIPAVYFDRENGTGRDTVNRRKERGHSTFNAQTSKSHPQAVFCLVLRDIGGTTYLHVNEGPKISRPVEAYIAYICANGTFSIWRWSLLAGRD